MAKKKYNPTFKSQSFFGKCALKDGKKVFKINHPELLQQFLNNHVEVGNAVTCVLTSKKPKRSDAQNNYLWLYYSLISRASGNDVDELHAWAKGKFLTTGISEVFGEKTRKVKSTTELTIPEFCEFVARIEEKTEVPAPKTEPFLKALTHEEYNNLKKEQQDAYDKMEANFVIEK